MDRAVGAVVNVVTAQAGGSQCSSAAGAAYWLFTGGVSCNASQAQYYDFDPVDTLSVAGHGAVNFAGGFVNGASSLVNGLSGAVNWGNNTCASLHLCVDIPDIPAIPDIPIWGDYDTYKYSSWVGSGTLQAVVIVATAGIGSGGLGAEAVPALINASGWNLVKAGASKVGGLFGLGKGAEEAARLAQAAEAARAAEAVEAARTGTVWDDLVATQATYSGSELPRSFTLSAGETEVWVSGNASEHMAEYLQAIADAGATPARIDIATQAQLSSLQAAVAEAANGGLVLDQLITVGGWQLKFAAPRAPGQLPALIHALYKG